ncbi:MAG: arginine--tRNA ligase [Haloarculaceae archaeon]
MFRAMRAEVEDALEGALADLGYPTGDLGIERPPADVDAVLATSVAYRLASEAGEPPAKVATELAEALTADFLEAESLDADSRDADSRDADTLTYVGAIEAQGPYCNFLPSEVYLEETLHAAASRDDYGALPDRETSLVLEHTSANPTGPVHVGRARNPIIGDALRRILDYAGYDVETHYYVNDAGRQMAVFTWAYETFDESDLDSGPERDSPEYDLVRYYRKGNDVLENADPDRVDEAEAEIQAILQGLEAGDEATYERVGEVVDTVLAGMTDTLDRLPAPFDEFVKETRFMRDGSTDEVVERLEALEGAVYEDEAWQLTFEDIDKNLVFLRADGTSLYTTRDVAHHEWKLETYDEAVTVLGEDHKLQADQLEATLDELGHDTDRLRSIHYSWVNLPEGGMSTRKGTGVDLDDLLDEAVDRARAEVEDRVADRLRDDHLEEADLDRIAHQVGIGAVRYDIVSKQPTKGITFEWDRALDFEAQSGPYVQYVHARACGILDEAAAAGIDAPEVDQPTADHGAPADAVDAALLDAPEERALLREVARFPAEIEAAAESLEPHSIATYTRDFAESFNAFYRECPVLDAEDDRRAARLVLVAAARTTVGNALDALGVAAPESM